MASMGMVAQCTACKAGPQSQHHFRKWVKEGELLHFKKGQVLFYEGHLPFGFFLLNKGTVLPPPMEDKTLGLLHLLSGTPYCSTCTAASDIEVLFFPKTLVFSHLAPSK